MFQSIVYMLVCVSVINGRHIQQRGSQKGSGALLRVVEQPSAASVPSASRVFYYIPTNVDVPKNSYDNIQEPSVVSRNQQLIKKTMNMIAENLKSGGEINEEAKQNEEFGFYHIYHPNGVLQRVEYANKKEDDKMMFSTSVRYRNVEPIKGPIYTYDPQTLIFRQI